jgi:hypothetical protein
LPAAAAPAPRREFGRHRGGGIAATYPGSAAQRFTVRRIRDMINGSRRGQLRTLTKNDFFFATPPSLDY